MGSVFVKRAGTPTSFAPVDILAGDAVGHLAERAALKRGWDVDAAFVELFLVPAEHADAVAEGSGGDFEARLLAARPLSAVKALSAVGICHGACLLARLPVQPGAAVHGVVRSGIGGGGDYNPEEGIGSVDGVRIDSNSVVGGDSDDFILAATSAFVLDGPIPDARGQTGVELLYAFRGSRVCCAKVGGKATLQHEFDVAAAVHAAVLAPTVVRMLALEAVTRRASVEPYAALIMPLYSLTVGAAACAMDAGVAAAQSAFALNVAVCTLSAVAAFDLAGLAHGDIKPSNLLLASDGSGLVVLCDLGTARRRGQAFSESSAFSLNLARTASLRYDIVSLGATLASVLSARINVGRCVDVAELRNAIGGLGDAERASPLWRFVEACLGFAEDGAAAELEALRALLAGIAEEMRATLGPHAATVLGEGDVWPRRR